LAINKHITGKVNNFTCFGNAVTEQATEGHGNKNEYS
jgi:hypothetical protein